MEGVPKYLKKKWGESRWKRMARFRLRNEMLRNKYWEDEERKKCRLCGKKEESWVHVWKKCRRVGESWQEAVREILGEKEKGEWWMR